MLGDVTINALQTNFLTDQRAVIQANSTDEREGISGWTVVKYVGGALAVIGGVAIIAGSLGTLSAVGGTIAAGGITAISGGVISATAGAVGSLVGGAAITGRRSVICCMGSKRYC